jgi:hypothetical protein
MKGESIPEFRRTIKFCGGKRDAIYRSGFTHEPVHLLLPYSTYRRMKNQKRTGEEPDTLVVEGTAFRVHARRELREKAAGGDDPGGDLTDTVVESHTVGE